MKNKPLVMTAIIVIVIALAAVVAWPLMAGRMGNQRQPGSILGEWTANNSSAGVSVYKWGTLSRATILGFGPNGREIVDAFVPVPHHPRPLPISSIGKYQIHGSTLVQTLPSRSGALASLGLHADQTATQTTLTSTFAVHDNQLILSQPGSGKTVSFTLTAAAIPPTSAPGSGPSGAGKGH